MKRVALLVMLLLATAGFAQEFSERREIAVFQLGYYGMPTDPAVTTTRATVQLGVIRFDYREQIQPRTTDIFERALGSIDEQIRSVFINLGRFEVIGLSKRLSAENVDAYIETLRQVKEEEIELPETVLLGQEAFTEADFNRLTGDFIVVVPTVSFYNLSENDEGEFESTIETSFTFIDVRERRAIEQFFIETGGVDDDPVDAMRSAVDGIPMQLSFQIRNMDIFRIRTGVLDVAGREIMMEFGENMGVVKGDEYAIVRSRILPTGHTADEQTGLIAIKEVQEGFSLGYLYYADPDPVIGDQLVEVPRYGIEVNPYARVLADVANARYTFVPGLRATASRGFFQTRPQVGVEIPFTATILGFYVPVNVYVGGEYNLMLGRLKANPSFGLGVGSAIPVNDEVLEEFATHLGGQGMLSLSYLAGRDVMIHADLGYAYWFGLYDRIFEETVLDRFFAGYGGILVGAGVSFK
ncbi:MAG: hypothetical protein ACOC45_03090 [Alkalispirochaetaceae bacterium]